MRFPAHAITQSVLAGSFAGFSIAAIYTLRQISADWRFTIGIAFGSALICVPILLMIIGVRSSRFVAIALGVFFFLIVGGFWLAYPNPFPFPFQDEWPPWMAFAKDMGILWAMLAVFTLPWYAQSVRNQDLGLASREISIPISYAIILMFVGFVILGIWEWNVLSADRAQPWGNQFFWIPVCRDAALVAMAVENVWWRWRQEEDRNAPFVFADASKWEETR